MTEPSTPKIDRRGKYLNLQTVVKAGQQISNQTKNSMNFIKYSSKITQNILKNDDFEKFKKIIKEKLPVSFRISFNSQYYFNKQP